MADFTSTGESKTTCFARREGRKVVVEDEGFALSAASEAINFLSVTASAECRDDECLSFTAVEHGRTVNSWENASLAGYSAKIGRAATVDSPACFEDILAIKLLLNFIKGASDVVTLDVFSA